MSDLLKEVKESIEKMEHHAELAYLARNYSETEDHIREVKHQKEVVLLMFQKLQKEIDKLTKCVEDKRLDVICYKQRFNYEKSRADTYEFALKEILEEVNFPHSDLVLSKIEKIAKRALKNVG